MDVWESFEISGQFTGSKRSPAEVKFVTFVYLEERFGPGDWLKLKGFATVRLEDGTMHEAEIHWYETDGVGKRWVKIKRFFEPSR